MNRVNRSVRELRRRLGDSQQAFANRLGLSIRAIANYEKDRKPSADALSALSLAAYDAGLSKLYGVFFVSLMKELDLTERDFNKLADASFNTRLTYPLRKR